MNDAIVVTLQPRGQITLPKRYRDFWGLGGGAILKTKLVDRKVIVEPLEEAEPNVIKPTISRQEYLKVLKSISAHIKKHGPLWTKADDRRRAESLRVERHKWEKLNW